MPEAARTTVATLLAEARALGIDRLDAHMLLERALNRSRTWLLAHDDEALTGTPLTTLRAWLARRASGEPVAYLLGEKEFHGLRLQVDANVLVPRPDTEVLVDWALVLLAGDLADRATPAVIDLGTGSGAIALAVKNGHPAADVLATDLSPAALAVASGNAERLGLCVHFQQGAWWEATAGKRFDLVLSNPPYIAGDDHHLAALHHEPRLALTPEGDGLAALREIIAGATAQLQPGGWLLLEHGHDQAASVANLLRAHGFSDVQSRADLAGHWRCTGGHA